VYGDRVFPLQATFLLSVPGKDFTGGEFVLTEQRPRIQSRAEVVSLEEGDGVIFAVHQRPVHGIRGASGQSPSRRKPHSLWSPAHHGDDFPRRKVSDGQIEMDSFSARPRVPKLKCSRKGRCFSGASP
jgi:Oxygenase, catalysing oxidative methylation of damaged DNA